MSLEENVNENVKPETSTENKTENNTGENREEGTKTVRRRRTEDRDVCKSNLKL